MHAKLIEKNVNNLYNCWYVEGGGHNNIAHDKKFRKNYYLKMIEYINYLKNL